MIYGRIARISTDHLPPADMALLETQLALAWPIAVFPALDGVFINVEDFQNLDDGSESIPESVCNVIDWAANEGLGWLRIDASGERVEDLEIYNDDGEPE